MSRTIEEQRIEDAAVAAYSKRYPAEAVNSLMEDTDAIAEFFHRLLKNHNVPMSIAAQFTLEWIRSKTS